MDFRFPPQPDFSTYQNIPEAVQQGGLMFAPQILTQLIELTSNVANAFTAALFVADPIERVLVLREFHTLSLNLDPEARIPYGKGPLGLVAETGKPFFKDKFEEDSSALGMYKASENLKGFMALPVVSDGDLVGVLALDTKESYNFSSRLEKIIPGFADQMAWYLSHEKPPAGGKPRDSFPYRDVIRYGQSIADSLQPSAIADRLARIPISVIQYDAVAVVWMDDERRTGRIVRHMGWDEDLSSREVVLGKGVAGSSMKNRVPILVQDLDRHKAVVFAEKERLDGFKSVLSVPVMFREELLGVVVCAAKARDGLGAVDQERLAMLAGLAAPAVFYAREKRQWDYDKNLDQVTGIPNHRCLVEYREKIEAEVCAGAGPIYLSTVRLKNLLALYETHGVAVGDKLLRQVVSVLSKGVPSPKFVFKYADAAFLILIMKLKRGEIESLETRLRQVFDKTPFFVDGRTIMIEAELGLSVFPDEGTNLCELAGLSWARASRNAKVNHDS
jgi:GGDEF domain-containing protein/putative methionine-R-sulfoxide reductase with GAF domain